jgi:hypothetical protein
MNSKAAVRFFFTKNSSANWLNRCSVSAAVGGGLMAWHGRGVTQDCLAARTLVGGSGNAEAGKTNAARKGTTNAIHILYVCASKDDDGVWM